jgi:polyisoprenoid-binding protein YceI
LRHNRFLQQKPLRSLQQNFVLPLSEKEIHSMKHLALAAGIFALISPLAFAQTSTWVSDPNHSEVDFGITHLTVSKVHGRFGSVNATIVFNDADVSKSTVTATIGIGTVDTGVDRRDADLKSASFFDATTLPTATFTSTGVTKNGNKLSVAGNLTLHGVTKPVTLEVEGPTATITDQKGRLHAGYSATTTLDRSAFNIGPKYGPSMIGNDVNLDIELEVIKQ